MAIFTAAFAFFCKLTATREPVRRPPMALAIGRHDVHIGPVAIFVLVLLLLASLYSWM